MCQGWFTEPAPFFTGPLEPEDAEEVLNEALEPTLEAFEGLSGLLTGAAGAAEVHAWRGPCHVRSGHTLQVQRR